MNNNINIQNKNLLIDVNFIESIKFEAAYAQKVKGGHLPYYIGPEKTKRLVSPINLLSNNEKQDLIRNSYIGKN
ncbi:MAG: hypothetical protein SFY56_13140 [Bacteroidota bacterium]|nr:hypothetical protein [Bacteroidota bacterium]